MISVKVDDAYKSPKSTVVALGNFDGVHIGHAMLLRAASDKAREMGALPAALTFDPDPANVIAKGCVSPILTDSEEKAYQMSLLGIEKLFIKPFDKNIMNMSPRQFVENILVNQLNAKYVICGFHYRFGYKGTGDAEKLRTVCKAFDIETLIIKPITVNGNLVSASVIRELLADGKTEEAALYLGRPYSVNFIVVEGKKLGRTLGFPTINQNFPDCHIIPKRGIYASVVLVKGRRYAGVSNIGVRPTVEKTGAVNIETYIIGCDADLYGQRARVEIFRRLRDENKFSDISQLRKAIQNDAEQSERIFKQLNF